MQVINYIELVVCIWRTSIKNRVRKLVSGKFQSTKDLLYLERQVNFTTDTIHTNYNFSANEKITWVYISLLKKWQKLEKPSIPSLTLFLSACYGTSSKKSPPPTPSHSSPGSSTWTFISSGFHLLSFNIDSAPSDLIPLDIIRETRNPETMLKWLTAVE